MTEDEIKLNGNYDFHIENTPFELPKAKWKWYVFGFKEFVVEIPGKDYSWWFRKKSEFLLGSRFVKVI